MVDANNVIKQREIEVIAELENIFIIGKGLSKNDKILLDGIRKVKNNEKIVSEYVNPATIFSNLKLFAE